MDLLIVLCAVACILYFAGIFVYAGPGSTFAWFWLFVGLLLLAWFLYRRGVKHKIIHFLFPLWIKVSILTTLILGAAVFVLAEILICSSMLSRPSPGLDYIVVLGAQVKGEQVSNSLKKRLDTALEYLLENEETVAVVSGRAGAGGGYHRSGGDAALSDGTRHRKDAHHQRSIFHKHTGEFKFQQSIYPFELERQGRGRRRDA